VIGRRTLSAALSIGLFASCVDGMPRGRSSLVPSPSPTTSRSNEGDGLAVERLRVSSYDDLTAAVAERGGRLLIFLPDARPTEVHFWEGTGHLHIRTEYIDRRGGEVVIIQAGLDRGDSLTEGRAIRVRGHRGVEAGRTWYWRERGWVIAAPADPAIVKRLRWLPTV